MHQFSLRLSISLCCWRGYVIKHDKILGVKGFTSFLSFRWRKEEEKKKQMGNRGKENLYPRNADNNAT